MQEGSIHTQNKSRNKSNSVNINMSNKHNQKRKPTHWELYLLRRGPVH